MPTSINSHPQKDLLTLKAPKGRDLYIGSTLNNRKKANYILRFVVISTSLITILVGLLVLIRWILEISFLKSFHPDYISMKANTAICFVFLGTVLLLLNSGPKYVSLRIITGILITIVIIVSFISLLRYLLDWNAGIDEFLFKDFSTNNKTIYPGRLTSNTCVCFLLLGFALMLIDTKIKSLLKKREDDKTKTIPIVILTSSCEEKDIIEGCRQGTNAYDVKPVVFKDFMDAVNILGAFWGIINVSPVEKK